MWRWRGREDVVGGIWKVEEEGWGRWRGRDREAGD